MTANEEDKLDLIGTPNGQLEANSIFWNVLLYYEFKYIATF